MPDDETAVEPFDVRYRAAQAEVSRLRAALAIRDAAIGAAVKGCRECDGTGAILPSHAGPALHSQPFWDCPACCGLRAALEENHGPLR